jgi:hypothetical protein
MRPGLRRWLPFLLSLALSVAATVALYAAGVHGFVLFLLGAPLLFLPRHPPAADSRCPACHRALPPGVEWSYCPACGARLP